MGENTLAANEIKAIESRRGIALCYALVHGSTRRAHHTVRTRTEGVKGRTNFIKLCKRITSDKEQSMELSAAHIPHTFKTSIFCGGQLR